MVIPGEFFGVFWPKTMENVELAEFLSKFLQTGLDAVLFLRGGQGAHKSELSTVQHDVVADRGNGILTLMARSTVCPFALTYG